MRSFELILILSGRSCGSSVVISSPTGASSSQPSEERSALNTGQTLSAGRGMGPPDTTWFQCMGSGMKVIFCFKFVGQ